MGALLEAMFGTKLLSNSLLLKCLLSNLLVLHLASKTITRATVLVLAVLDAAAAAAAALVVVAEAAMATV